MESDQDMLVFEFWLFVDNECYIICGNYYVECCKWWKMFVEQCLCYYGGCWWCEI